MDAAARRAAMARLAPLVGAWTTETSLPAVAGHGPGEASSEWTLDSHFLLQRSTVPGAPDSIAIIGPDPEHGGYLQHYFDARGVVRIYAMDLADGAWTLERHVADFSPLDFRQRFSGRVSGDGTRIAGAWATSSDGSTWERDFELRFTRVGAPGDVAGSGST